MSYVLEHENEAKRLEDQSLIPQYSLESEFKLLSLDENDCVLDAGCGSGVVSRFLAKKFPQTSIEACDFSAPRINQARELNKSLDIEFFVSDLEDLNLSSERYDHIVSRYVFEHLINPQKVCDELYRVCKPGGQIYIVDFDGIFINLFSQNKRFNYLFDRIKNGLKSDLRIGSKLSHLVKNSGFHEIEYHVSSVQFLGDDKKLEYQNNVERCNNCFEDFSTILDSDILAKEFCNLYLSESLKEENAYFYNKFIVTAKKKSYDRS